VQDLKKMQIYFLEPEPLPTFARASLHAAASKFRLKFRAPYISYIPPKPWLRLLFQLPRLPFCQQLPAVFAFLISLRRKDWFQEVQEFNVSLVRIPARRFFCLCGHKVL